MNLIYKCEHCQNEFETTEVYNGFCPYCNYDRMGCLNFDEWERMTQYGKKIQASLDFFRKARKEGY